jgi:hypothetical protein
MNKQYFKGKTGLIFFLITLLFVVTSSFFYENKTLYTNFVDEEDNMVSAKYILSGQELYKDIFEQHQPTLYLISSGIQKVVNPGSIFLLIKRHREFVIIWSDIWDIVIAGCFGWVGLGFVLIYELTKHFLFGNFFLAEAFSVYPLVFLVGKTIQFSGEKIKLLEFLFYGICFSFLVFTLAPIWPLLLFLMAVFVLKHRAITLKDFFIFLLGFLLVLIPILPFISVQGYIKDVLYFNSKYYIPLSGEQLNAASIVKSFFSFLLAFESGLEKTPILIVIQILSLVLITGFVYFAKKRNFSIFFILLIILGLANIRFVQPGLDFYRGFHLLPWFAILVFIASYIFAIILRDKKFRILLLINIILSLLLVITIDLADSKTLFIKRNLDNDYYIYYSNQFDMGTAISIMKNNADTLFVYPDESLIYWQAGIKKATPYVFFYPFMENIPFVLNEVSAVFEKTPPTYFYCTNCQESKFAKYLKMYTPILKNGKETDLYILNSKIESLSKENRNQLSFYKFSFSK